MKKVLFLLLLPFLFVESCLATKFYPEDSSPTELRYRGTDSYPKYSPLMVEDDVSKKKSISSGSLKGIIDKNENRIFSSLGDIWEAFEAGNFDGYFDGLIQLQLKNVPEALYLLGLVHKEGYGRINKSLRQATSYYTRALAFSKENSDLYYLALDALKECQEEALKNAKMPFSY